MTDYKLGQKVFVVLSLNRREPRKQVETITKIGRKWVYYGEGHKESRFNPETGMIDGEGHNSPGKVWPSEQEYKLITGKANEWDKIRKLTQSLKAPDHLSWGELISIRLKLFPESKND